MSNLLVNRNIETGIRYGVIPSNDLFNAGEQFYADAEDTRHTQYLKDVKDELLHAIFSVVDQRGLDIGKAQSAADEAYEDIEQDLNDHYESDGTGLHYDDGEYLIDKLDETDLFVAKSPYFTFAPECSPCAPGACYLRDGIIDTDEDPAKKSYEPDEFTEVGAVTGKEMHKTYCLGHEWFEDTAPYAVYSVETGQLIEP